MTKPRPPQPMTDEQIADVRRRAAAASAGPYRVVDCRRQKHGQIRIFSDAPGVHGIIANVLASGDNATADADFFGHSRRDVDDLLAQVDWLTAQLAEARAGQKSRAGFDDAINWLLNSRHTGDRGIQASFWAYADGLVTEEEANSGFMADPGPHAGRTVFEFYEELRYDDKADSSYGSAQ